MANDGHATGLLGTLVRLREVLVASPLPLDTTDVEEARKLRQEMVDQLEDYILPRIIQIDAPVLTVVGGSTGAGKSTLVNSLVGERVTEPGVLRPTTRSPVLVHHPLDASWFHEARILPDLARTSGATAEVGYLQVVASENVPAGLAILDAPDIDSVDRHNRELAVQLLAAADLWLFVTSAARYADQVPWELLKDAAERSTAVAIVLNRTPPKSVREVSSHLARMLSTRRLGDSPLFAIPESPVDKRGILPAKPVEPIRTWLQSLAKDTGARETVIHQTLDGAVRSLNRRTREIAEAAQAQNDFATELQAGVDTAYAERVEAVSQATQDGTLLRGEVLARWQEFVATGELMKSLEERISRWRDRVASAVRGRPHSAQKLTSAVGSALESLLVEHAEGAAEGAAASWRSTAAGQELLDGASQDLSRASREFRAAAQRVVREWQQGVLDMVRAEGADRRSRARMLAYGVNALGVALMIVVFVRTAGLSESQVGNGRGRGSAVLGQKLLEAVFGGHTVRRMAEYAHADLRRRVEALMRTERQRYYDVLGELPISAPAPQQLRQLARDIDDARLAGAAR